MLTQKGQVLLAKCDAPRCLTPWQDLSSQAPSEVSTVTSGHDLGPATSAWVP